MANTIKIKRKPLANGAGVPSSLVAGELAFSEADAKLFYGLDSGGGVSPIEIAGSGYVINQITNYAPSKSGVGASGTWNISISGNAATVTSGVYTSRNITAGSGLAGGGNLSSDITINIGQGDGINVSSDTIAVDNTVVRTTGVQSIDGQKTISDVIFNGSIQFINLSGITSGANYIPVFKEIQGPDTEQSPLVFISNNNLKTDLSLNNVTNNAQVKKISSSTIGYVPTWSVNTGDELGTGYSVETTLSGGSGALPRADAVKNYVDSLLGATDAMVFKGTIGSGGTVTSLPTTHSAGWTYRVITAGTYAGQVCEVGDLIIAVVDRSGTGNLNSDWTVAQNNLDGAVIGPASATSDGFVLFDGTTGKLIKDAGYTTIPVNKGGTGQTTYTDGQLLIGNSTGNTLTKSTLTEGTGIDITNGAGSITITHEDTSTLNGLQGGNGIASITVDGLGHVTAIGTATYLTSGTVCAAIADCTIDGGTFT